MKLAKPSESHNIRVMRILFVLLLLLGFAGICAAQADVSITVSDSQDPVVLGTNGNYVITVVNNGPAEATNVVLSDAITANTVFQSLAGPEGWQCTAPKVGASGTISCTIQQVKANASSTFTIVAKPTSAGMMSNTGNITSDTNDPNPQNNTDYEDTTILNAPQN